MLPDFESRGCSENRARPSWCEGRNSCMRLFAELLGLSDSSCGLWLGRSLLWCHFSILQIQFRETSKSKLVAGENQEKSDVSADTNVTASPSNFLGPGIRPFSLELSRRLLPASLLWAPGMRLCSRVRRCLAALIRVRQTAGSAAPQDDPHNLPPNTSLHITCVHSAVGPCSQLQLWWEQVSEGLLSFTLRL